MQPFRSKLPNRDSLRSTWKEMWRRKGQEKGGDTRRIRTQRTTAAITAVIIRAVEKRIIWKMQ
eukprot:7183636-Heterocapsa_arctica.AAC.1